MTRFWGGPGRLSHVASVRHRVSKQTQLPPAPQRGINDIPVRILGAHSQTRGSMQDADFSAGLQAENLRTGMKDRRYFYIDGKWVSPAKSRDFMVVNPATEQPIATISLGSAADVEKAVGAAKRAFASYSETTVGERLGFLEKIIEVYRSKINEMAETIPQEMGA